MWTGALSAIPPSRNVPSKDVLLTPEQTEQVIEAIADALEDAELTVDELTEAIVARTGPWAGDLVMPAFQGMWPRWRWAEGTAANRGALCFGPNRGRNVTYTSPRRWLPGFRPADGQTALASLVKRYLHAYGPATPQHFARWLAAPPRWATELFDTLSGELQQVEVERQRGMGSGRRYGCVVHSATGCSAAPLLRRLRGRLPPARPALPWPSRRARAVWRPGGKLTGAAHRRGGRRAVAPAPLWTEARDHGRAVRSNSPPRNAASLTTRWSASDSSSKALPA